MGKTAFDLVIIDASRDGCEEGRFSREEISVLRNSPGGKKFVLAYLSIGEAEIYRGYWDPAWVDGKRNPTSCAPSWLGPQNPEWEGNYKVRYWDPRWQALIFSHLDKIVQAGFDGVYLDIIDAYEYWGPGGDGKLDRTQAEDEMVEFVMALARHARSKGGGADFGVFPQNAEGLSSHVDYVQAVTGIGREDTWYDGNSPRDPDDMRTVVANLDVFRDAGKLVLCTDYVARKSLIDDFYSKARARGYVPYATVRALDCLTVNPGHEPD
jgi:cysteinyl-tRNA synthetase